MLLGPMTKGRERELSPLLRQFLGWVAKEPTHTAHTLLYSWLQRDELRAQFLAQMRVFSVIVCPVAAIPAFRHGERSWRVEGQEVMYLDAWSYTEWFNLLGLPACVVPVTRSAEGLMCSEHKRLASSELSAESRRWAGRMFRMPVAALAGQAWPKNVGQDLRKFLMQIVQRHLDKKLVTLPMLGKLA
jgi:hypothetical protein